MRTTGAAAMRRAKSSADLSHDVQPRTPSARERQIRRLADVLHALDDRALAQIGLERTEIERFAQADVAHNL